jgi:hypothetical protein
MADEEGNDVAQRLDPMEDPKFDWVGPDPRGTVLAITSTSPGVFTVLEEDPAVEKFTAYAPKSWRRVCSELKVLGCYMYEVVFKDLGLRLPFSQFEIKVFKHLNLATIRFCRTANRFSLCQNLGWLSQNPFLSNCQLMSLSTTNLST